VKQDERLRALGVPFQIMEPGRTFEEMPLGSAHFRSSGWRREHLSFAYLGFHATI